MQPVLVKESGGKRVKIFFDQESRNREDFGETLGTILYTGTGRYVLGDRRATPEAMKQIEKCKEFIYLPVYAYVHGGVALSTQPFSCPWDSGQSGIIYASREKVRTALGVKRLGKKLLQKAFDALSEEVREYSKILNGEVYGYILEDESGKEIDSCWGFIDEPEKIADEALIGNI